MDRAAALLAGRKKLEAFRAKKRSHRKYEELDSKTANEVSQGKGPLPNERVLPDKVYVSPPSRAGPANLNGAPGQLGAQQTQGGVSNVAHAEVDVRLAAVAHDGQQELRRARAPDNAVASWVDEPVGATPPAVTSGAEAHRAGPAPSGDIGPSWLDEDTSRRLSPRSWHAPARVALSYANGVSGEEDFFAVTGQGSVSGAASGGDNPAAIDALPSPHSEAPAASHLANRPSPRGPGEAARPIQSSSPRDVVSSFLAASDRGPLGGSEMHDERWPSVPKGPSLGRAASNGSRVSTSGPSPISGRQTGYAPPKGPSEGGVTAHAPPAPLSADRAPLQSERSPAPGIAEAGASNSVMSDTAPISQAPLRPSHAGSVSLGSSSPAAATASDGATPLAHEGISPAAAPASDGATPLAHEGISPAAAPQPGRRRERLQRLAPAARWLVTGAGKAMTYLAGADGGENSPRAGRDSHSAAGVGSGASSHAAGAQGPAVSLDGHGAAQLGGAGTCADGPQRAVAPAASPVQSLAGGDRRQGRGQGVLGPAADHSVMPFKSEDRGPPAAGALYRSPLRTPQGASDPDAASLSSMATPTSTGLSLSPPAMRPEVQEGWPVESGAGAHGSYDTVHAPVAPGGYPWLPRQDGPVSRPAASASREPRSTSSGAALAREKPVGETGAGVVHMGKHDEQAVPAGAAAAEEEASASVVAWSRHAHDNPPAAAMQQRDPREGSGAVDTGSHAAGSLHAWLRPASAAERYDTRLEPQSAPWAANKSPNRSLSEWDETGRPPPEEHAQQASSPHSPDFSPEEHAAGGLDGLQAAGPAAVGADMIDVSSARQAPSRSPLGNTMREPASGDEGILARLSGAGDSGQDKHGLAEEGEMHYPGSNGTGISGVDHGEHRSNGLDREGGSSSLGVPLRPPSVPQPPSSDKGRALQAYISDLESQKFELQRGLQQQAVALSRLAEEHAAASARFESIAGERDDLQAALSKCQAALAEQVAEAAAAREEAAAAQRTAQGVLEGQQGLAAENVVLEDKLLAARREVLELRQAESEWGSRIAAERNTAVKREAASRGAYAQKEQELARLGEQVAALEAAKASLLVRLRDMAAARKGNPGVGGADSPSGPFHTRVLTAHAVAQTDAVAVAESACQCDLSAAEPAPPAHGGVGTDGAGRGQVTDGTEERMRVSARPSAESADLLVLREPVSARIASAAAAALGALPAEDAAALRTMAPHRRRLLPRLHALASDSGVLAETQVAVLASIHAHISRLEGERRAMAAELAALRGGSSAWHVGADSTPVVGREPLRAPHPFPAPSAASSVQLDVSRNAGVAYSPASLRDGQNLVPAAAGSGTSLDEVEVAGQVMRGPPQEPRREGEQTDGQGTSVASQRCPGLDATSVVGRGAHPEESQERDRLGGHGADGVSNQQREGPGSAVSRDGLTSGLAASAAAKRGWFRGIFPGRQNGPPSGFQVHRQSG